MRSRSASILDLDGEAEFVNEELQSSDNSEDVEMPVVRERSREINYREDAFSSEGEEEEETVEGFNEIKNGDDDSHFLENLVEFNGKIDRICISREVDKTLEYLVTMQGEPYPLAQWFPDAILAEYPNFKGCLNRFNESHLPFSFYVASTHVFSTAYDSPLHIVGDRILEGTENRIYLFQFVTNVSTVYYWEMDLSGSSPKNIINYYNEHSVMIDAVIPEKRPQFNEIRIEYDKEDPKALDYFRSKHGYVPRDYQVDGVNWLLQCFCDQHGCILADEMGLGKTIQAICFLKQLQKFGWYGPHIIVVRNNTYNQWCSELEEWSDFNFVMYKGDPSDRRILRHFRCRKTGDNKYKYNILLVAYDILIKDYEEFKDTSFEIMLIDEGHRLKQRYGQTHLAFDSLVAEHRVIMTGTPIQNNLQELWSLLNFVSPEYFSAPEEFPDEDVDSLEPEKMEQLRNTIAPHLMRRSLEDVESSIVPKDERFVFIELTKAQKDLTRLTKLHELWRIQGADRTNYQEGQMLHRICNHPFMIEGAEEYFLTYCNMDRQEALIKTCSKFLFLDRVLPIFKREKRSVLIFSQRIKVLNLLAEYCCLRKYTYVMLDGQLTTDEKKVAIDSFSSDDSSIFIFLISTKSGAEGLNLTKASVTIIFDPDWNPNNDLQALGRCHRIGQTKQVLVLRLITYGSYEHLMYIKAQKKLKLWDAVLGDGMKTMTMRANTKPRKISSMLAKPYAPVKFADASRIEFEKAEPSEKVERPPNIEEMEEASKDETIDNILEECSTVLNDISNCYQQEELSFDEGESKEDFLSRFNTEEVNLSQKRRRRTKPPAFTFDANVAVAILSALEKYGYGEYKKIMEESGCQECPIELFSRFCVDSIIFFFRALEETGFLRYPLLACCVVRDKRCNLGWLMCPDRDEWFSIPITKRGSVVGSLKQFVGTIHRTAPYFLQSIENKLIAKSFRISGLKFKFNELPPPFASQTVDDKEIVKEILENRPISNENRANAIMRVMKGQLIESKYLLQPIFCPLWGRPEIMEIFSLLKNFGDEATRMSSQEVSMRTGLLTKSGQIAKLFLARLFASLKKESGQQQMKVPTDATGGTHVGNFGDFIIIEQREMISLLRRTEIMSLIPKALENIPENEEILQARENEMKVEIDCKGWFTNMHLRKMLTFMQNYGFNSLVNLLLSDSDFFSHFTEADIHNCENGVDILSEGNIPDFLWSDQTLLSLLMNIANVSDPIHEMKTSTGKLRAAKIPSTVEEAPKKVMKVHKKSTLEVPKSPVKHHSNQKIRMKIPKISALYFYTGKPSEAVKNVNLAVAKWKRNIPVDERREYLDLLQGK